MYLQLSFRFLEYLTTLYISYLKYSISISSIPSTISFLSDPMITTQHLMLFMKLLFMQNQAPSLITFDMDRIYIRFYSFLVVDFQHRYRLFQERQMNLVFGSLFPSVCLLKTYPLLKVERTSIIDQDSELQSLFAVFYELEETLFNLLLTFYTSLKAFPSKFLILLNFSQVRLFNFKLFYSLFTTTNISDQKLNYKAKIIDGQIRYQNSDKLYQHFIIYIIRIKLILPPKMIICGRRMLNRRSQSLNYVNDWTYFYD